jgi:hypothetical protein
MGGASGTWPDVAVEVFGIGHMKAALQNDKA